MWWGLRRDASLLRHEGRGYRPHHARLYGRRRVCSLVVAVAQDVAATQAAALPNPRGRPLADLRAYLPVLLLCCMFTHRRAGSCRPRFARVSRAFTVHAVAAMSLPTGPRSPASFARRRCHACRTMHVVHDCTTPLRPPDREAELHHRVCLHVRSRAHPCGRCARLSVRSPSLTSLSSEPGRRDLVVWLVEVMVTTERKTIGYKR